MLNKTFTGLRVRLSPIPFITDTWNQTYSSACDENYKHSSCMDIDGCKTNSVNARAPSTDSLNIRTDEKMPAKGEISEQESNGDVEGLWSHQVCFFLKLYFRSNLRITTRQIA